MLFADMVVVDYHLVGLEPLPPLQLQPTSDILSPTEQHRLSRIPSPPFSGTSFVSWMPQTSSLLSRRAQGFPAQLQVHHSFPASPHQGLPTSASDTHSGLKHRRKILDQSPLSCFGKEESDLDITNVLGDTSSQQGIWRDVQGHSLLFTVILTQCLKAICLHRMSLSLQKSSQVQCMTSSSIASSSNGKEIIQPNLSHPWTARSALFIPELLTEIFQYSTLEDLYAHATVCLDWEEPAQARLLETVELGNANQMRYLNTKPTYRRYVRDLITSVDFDTPVHKLRVPELNFCPELPILQYKEHPMSISAWHLVGPVPLPSSEFLIIRGIYSYSSTLRTFHVHDSLWLSPEVFCDLLNALGNCQKLENLALPANVVFRRHETSIQRIARWKQASTRLVSPLHKPQIVRLQLVATYRRYRLCATRPSPNIHILWTSHPNCPFNFVHTLQLIVGQGEVLQHVLPVLQKLESLEICSEHPWFWSNYSLLLEAPLKLPLLKSLQMSFHHTSAVSSFLKIIRTPNIETIKIRYDKVWNPLHTPSLPNDLHDVVEEITKVGLGRSFPAYLAKIHLQRISDMPQPLPIDLPKWFTDIFIVQHARDVQLLLEPITIPDRVFMNAFSAPC
ncbi:hypothetical protein BDP27DRAFT_1424822 [Rhodocollybia butyracea]|uniref:F-box domain-containing protein n=1 Tax=Rhodocollybia butyracea TaxID=206335 RepID=A0A9P5PLM6_9AGAR|nr:hypothetical protein BDP27DRAFT_1424822 [Rhodocollybia butyracea]